MKTPNWYELKPVVKEHLEHFIKDVSQTFSDVKRIKPDTLAESFIEGVQGIEQGKTGVIRKRFNEMGRELFRSNMPAIATILELTSLEKDVLSISAGPVTRSINAIETARNWIAEAYFKEIIKDFVQNKPDLNDEMPKMEAGIREIYRIIDAISLNENKNQPADDCPMTRFLNGQFMDMACPDPKLRIHLQNKHRHVHYLVKKVVYFKESMDFHNALVFYEVLHAILYNLFFLLQKVLSDFQTNQEEYLFRFLKKRTENKERPVLAVIDIGRLDAINRIFGYQEGNRLLEGLRSGTEQVMRKHGIEGFAIKGQHGDILIVFDVSDDWKIKARKLFDEVTGRCMIADKIPVKVSVAFIEIQSGCTLDECRFLKEDARHNAKNSLEQWFIMDKNKVETIATLSHSALKDTEVVISALQRGEVQAFYQPIVELKTGRLCHFEALARIQNAGRWLPAGAFIGIIEKLGMYPRLDALIIQAVLKDARALEAVSNRIFINLSPMTLLTNEGINTVIKGTKALRQEGLYVAFELTEQVFLENPEVVEQLSREYGLIFSVDDFGTGFSSISSTIEMADKKLVDILKIDGSLVRDITTVGKKKRIVATIADMAANLGLKNIAEFVEDEKTTTLLLNMGVEMGQGYYFGKPMPVNELKAWIESRDR